MPRPDINSVEDEDFVNPFNNPPFISADGKKPRVKANIDNRFKQVRYRDRSMVDRLISPPAQLH